MACLTFNVEVVSRGIDARISDATGHLDMSCNLICAVELKWEQFVASDGDFYDSNNQEIMVKRA